MASAIIAAAGALLGLLLGGGITYVTSRAQYRDERLRGVRTERLEALAKFSAACARLWIYELYRLTKLARLYDAASGSGGADAPGEAAHVNDQYLRAESEQSVAMRDATEALSMVRLMVPRTGDATYELLSAPLNIEIVTDPAIPGVHADTEERSSARLQRARQSFDESARAALKDRSLDTIW